MKRLICWVAAISFLAGCSAGPKWYYQGQPATSVQVAQAKDECISKYSTSQDVHNRNQTTSSKQSITFDGIIDDVQQCMMKKGFFIATKNETHDFNGMLSQIANEINPYLPLHMEEFTVLDKVESGDKKLTYNFIITNDEIAANIDRYQLVHQLKTNFPKEACTIPYIDLFVANHVLMIVLFNDTQGKQIAYIEIPLSECQ